MINQYQPSKTIVINPYNPLYIYEHL
jgi:hypothetical protein